LLADAGILRKFRRHAAPGAVFAQDAAQDHRRVAVLEGIFKQRQRRWAATWFSWKLGRTSRLRSRMRRRLCVQHRESREASSSAARAQELPLASTPQPAPGCGHGCWWGDGRRAAQIRACLSRKPRNAFCLNAFRTAGGPFLLTLQEIPALATTPRSPGRKLS